MLIKLGICIMVWLIVGFIVGVKNIFVDKMLEQEEVIKKAKEKLVVDERTEKVFELAQKKSVMLITITLMGFYAFYLDTVGTFKKKRK